MLRIATHNVNGIRSAVRRGFGDWLAARDCDVVALQEVRCPAELIPTEAVAGYHPVSYTHLDVYKRQEGIIINKIIIENVTSLENDCLRSVKSSLLLSIEN